MQAGPQTGRSVRTTCPYCGVGCGVVATPQHDGSVAIAGDPDHPANFGRLCSKGSALGETLALDERLLAATIEGRAATLDEALDHVAERFLQTIAAHGPDSVAFYVSGQLLTEDYYVANKLMKGFIGSANIDTNSRLCMSSAVAGHRRAFGSDTVPGTYEDLEIADLVVIVGSNLAWCHPVLFQRIASAKAARPQMKIVTVDPRRTMTAEIADLHLPIAADGDVALFTGLLAHLGETGAIDRAYVDAHTSGLSDALAAAEAATIAAVATETGLHLDAIRQFYALFAGTPKVVTAFSQGVNQSRSGSDKVNAIVNCHLATGRIGKPGAGPFSITGQPNAMGGRDVGGLANMLAAHMDIENPDHRAIVQRVWQGPSVASKPGLKAVELFAAVRAGTIKALWIMGTNPVVSMPDADGVKAALAACPFVVVSDVVAMNDTLPYAHVALPAAAWGEKNGTVTNSERRISRQRPFLPLPADAQPDWRLISDVARRMGFAEAFSYSSPADIFKEHARLSAQDNGGTRDFDIGGLAALDEPSYESLSPVQWPVAEGAARPGGRMFAQGAFFHADGRARFVATPRPQAPPIEPSRRFTLNTGRVRDHWHTMTRTGLTARLSAHIAEPFVEIHPDDAAALGLSDADIARVSTAHGQALLRVLVTERQRPGSIFAPMHWNDRFASRARIGALVSRERDPLSGQPGFKATPAEIGRWDAGWYGFAVTRVRPEPISVDYWAMARAQGGWRMELASQSAIDARTAMSFARDLIGCGEEGDLLAYHDIRAGTHRFACFAGGVLTGALWIAREPVGVSRLWAAQQLTDVHSPAERYRLLAGRGGSDRPDSGAIVCSCFSVGVNDIARAVTAGGCSSVDAVGLALKAGTNCGSCRSEIKGIINGIAIRQTA